VVRRRARLDLKGRVSIDVFHLNRRRLRDLRQDTVAQVAALLEIVKEQRNADNRVAADDFEKFLDDHYLQDRHAHAAVARSVVDDPAAFGV
jgi:DNA polymerase elongation subunit (family B)